MLILRSLTCVHCLQTTHFCFIQMNSEVCWRDEKIIRHILKHTHPDVRGNRVRKTSLIMQREVSQGVCCCKLSIIQFVVVKHRLCMHTNYLPF